MVCDPDVYTYAVKVENHELNVDSALSSGMSYGSKEFGQFDAQALEHGLKLSKDFGNGMVEFCIKSIQSNFLLISVQHI